MTQRTQFGRRTFLRTTGVVAVGAVAGCSSDSSDGGDRSMDGNGSMDGNESMDRDGEMGGNESMDEDGGTMTDATSTITYEVDPLPELGMGHYEGWAIFGDEKVSTGSFGAGDDTTFEVDRDLPMADKFVVTIEPDDDSDPKPSGVVYAAGRSDGSMAELSFPVSFDEASGTYILATPTNGGSSDETSGIWFLDPSGPKASLDLPELPMGWVYEGWAVTGGTPITAGRFRTPTSADDFDGFSGSKEAPPFPGEDYLKNAPDGVDFPVDLTDGSSNVVVSVEPDVEGVDPTGPAPFAIKPLVGMVPGDGTDHTSYDLQRKTETTPTGMATIQ